MTDEADMTGSDERDRQAREITALAEQIWPHIWPHMQGKGPLIQGGVLADLVARWLAGHMIPGDRRETRRAREELLDLHVKTVRKLIPVNAKQLPAEVTHDE